MAVSSFARSCVEPVDGCGDCPPVASPLWARWNDELGQRYTLGIEEEVKLRDPYQWSLAQSSDQVLARLSDELSLHTSPETPAALVAGLADRFLAPDWPTAAEGRST